MTIGSIRAALEKRLFAMSPPIQTVYENTPQATAPGTPYQRVALLPAMPDNSEKFSNGYWEMGVFQITLCYPTGVGPSVVEQRADATRTQFKRGTTLVEAGISVLIRLTPKLGPAVYVDESYCVPVSVTYQAHITG